MSAWLLAREPFVRLALFLGVLAFMAAWELLAPRRRLTASKRRRWTHNWGIVLLDTALVRMLFPAGAVAVGLYVETAGWGLFQLLDLPLWLVVVLSVIVLDFAVWAQHVMFHAVPVLWRVHRMHHTDPDFDVTTGLRFHPIEIVLSFIIKAGVIVMIGAPAIAVLVFEVLLSSLALFNHSNARIAPRIDRLLRLFIVTPDFHRVHHSWHRAETDSNYGFNLSLWDRLLGTYRAQPRNGHEGMTIGLNLFRDPVWLRIDRLLIQPFVGPTHSTPPERESPDP